MSHNYEYWLIQCKRTGFQILAQVVDDKSVFLGNEMSTTKELCQERYSFIRKVENWEANDMFQKLSKQ